VKPRARPPTPELPTPELLTPELLTIGYEGTTLAQVIAALRAAQVELVIDVRAVPISRKPGFSKRLLAASLQAEKISYLHLQALGTPKAGRDAARAGDIGRMHRIFGAHVASDQAQADLAQAGTAARASRACLLCFEHDPKNCHRSLVADMVAATTGQRIVHVDPLA
jgi:uncharacterized protein (DUF488 family)